MEFYGILQDEPAYAEVSVYAGSGGHKLYSIPRSEFGVRSGLWTGDDEDEPDEESRAVVTEVQLIKPALIGEPRRWTFAKDGIEFSALMVDPMMLEAIRRKTLTVPISEGIIMRVEMHYKEKRVGGAWRAIPASRKIKRVLSPLPPPPSVPLFPTASGPQESN